MEILSQNDVIIENVITTVEARKSDRELSYCASSYFMKASKALKLFLRNWSALLESMEPVTSVAWSAAEAPSPIYTMDSGFVSGKLNAPSKIESDITTKVGDKNLKLNDDQKKCSIFF